ncbi:hypothetical protein BCR42DRAFT_421369 [Absidia repens]|uniref:UDENN domain-containing protein n=1 Tax=Absidia repens TaxID=90262 RepID=A0A1X2I8S0_9FUNG|nr:hypothetical protein BCR42DRAFT_421369 [Absidia repens]
MNILEQPPKTDTTNNNNTNHNHNGNGKKNSRSSKVDDTHTTISYPLPNNITAIFKVRFHVHRGNELVWQYPPDIDLQGVEYQMICSGLHLVEKDTIYFSRWNGTGVGVFENREINHDRGASMQAVGVLIALPSARVHPGPLNLWQHVSFLKSYLADSDDDSDHNDHHALEDYYNAHRYKPSATEQMHYYITRERLQQQQQWHTQDIPRAFSDMVRLLGPSVFVLWKAILLKQRILMMKPSPPMEQLCYFVYNAYLMDQWQSSTTPRIPDHMALKFNIGINDINDLEKRKESSYVACTSDTIFDIKKDLYDVLIKFPVSMKTSSTTIQPVESITTSTPINVNAADHVRFKLLMHLFPPAQQHQYQHMPLPSSWAFGRYECITWWDASVSGLMRQWNASGTPSSSMSRRRTQRYPRHQPLSQQISPASSSSSQQEQQQQQQQTQEYEHSIESMHSLQETSLLVEPSQQPITAAQERQMGGQVILDDTRVISSAPSVSGVLEYSDQPDQELAWGSAASVIPDTLSNTLLGFFHVLTLQLVSSLQTLVEDNDDDGDGNNNNNEVVLGIKEMVRLGLDPWDDQYLVHQLGLLYFNKNITVSACHDLKACCSSSCCCSRGETGAPIQL